MWAAILTGGPAEQPDHARASVKRDARDVDATLPDGVEIDYHYAVEQVFNELAEPTEAMIDVGGACSGGPVEMFKAMIDEARRER